MKTETVKIGLFDITRQSKPSLLIVFTLVFNVFWRLQFYGDICYTCIHIYIKKPERKIISSYITHLSLFARFVVTDSIFHSISDLYEKTGKPTTYVYTAYELYLGGIGSLYCIGSLCRNRSDTDEHRILYCYIL